MSDWSLYDKQVPFESLVGKTLTAIEGMKDDSENITFKCDDGSEFVMYHSQSCCESVSVESVVGDVDDLIGAPLRIAEESTSDQTPFGFKHEYEPESQTWTFYKLATIKGYVDLRWFGRSNGYYSETVSFAKSA